MYSSHRVNINETHDLLVEDIDIKRALLWLTNVAVSKREDRHRPDVLVQFCFMTYFVYFTVVRDDVINVSLANYENKIDSFFFDRASPGIANECMYSWPPAGGFDYLEHMWAGPVEGHKLDEFWDGLEFCLATTTQLRWNGPFGVVSARFDLKVTGGACNGEWCLWARIWIWNNVGV